MTESILIIDLETENHPYYGKNATPYCPENYIVESGFRIDRTLDDGTFERGSVNSVRYDSRDEFLAAKSKEWLPIPDDCWLIVAHNACYEISWFLQFARDSFEQFINRGGRVWCTMHGEYLATDQLSTYPSLDDTAPKYGGTKKVDGVKLLWKQGYRTSEIDPALLHKYLVDEKEGDVANTAMVFYGQYDVLEKQNKFPMIWTRMDAMLAFAYCEWFGMFVNMPVALANLKEQEQEIEDIKKRIATYFPSDMPEELEFKFSSHHHMSALVYGGPITYSKRISYDPPKYEKVDCVYDNEEDAYVLYLPKDYPNEYKKKRYKRYTKGKNAGLLKIERIDSDVEKLNKVDSVYVFKGIVDMNTLPDDLKDKFKITRGRRADYVMNWDLSDGSPVYSTSTEVMHKLAELGYEFCKDIVRLTALEKDTGTYYLRTEYRKDGSVKETKGMLQYVIPMLADGSGIIHHNLNTCATITGRLSSSYPNMQNIPRGGSNDKASKVKSLFTSRYGKDGRIIEIDYSAIEVVMSCCHSGDMVLLDLLKKDTDMHCYRLAGMEEIDYEEVLDLCHDKHSDTYDEWHDKRTQIKKPSFALQYGASASGMSYRTGLPLVYCERFIENEYKLFPKTYEFRDSIRKVVEESSKHPSMLFREYTDSGQVQLFRRGHWVSPTGMRYSFRQDTVWVRDEKTGRLKSTIDFKDTELANYWCQGEAFFVMVVAFALIIRYLVKNNFFDGQVALITNVHDAVYLDVANEQIGKKVGLAIKHIMEVEVKRYILTHWPNYGHLKDIEFPAAAEMGVSMLEKYDIEEAA